jgi:hypothetical protein
MFATHEPLDKGHILHSEVVITCRQRAHMRTHPKQKHPVTTKESLGFFLRGASPQTDKTLTFDGLAK